MKKNWVGAEIYMDSFNPDKTGISIRQTVERNRDLVPSLIPLHALTDCDTFPKLYGIGKAKALAVLKKHPLKYVGNSSADIENVKMEGRPFIAQCYGMKDTSSSKNRYFEILNTQNVDYLTGMFSKLLTTAETKTKMVHIFSQTVCSL